MNEDAFDVAKLLSAGVIVRIGPGAIVVGHASGTRHWDIPKGLIEPHESARDAAIRELKEETGVTLDGRNWEDLGRHAYNKSKDLWLFRTPVLSHFPAPSSLICASTFVDRFGTMRPELDRFRILKRSELELFLAPALARVLSGIEW